MSKKENDMTNVVTEAADISALYPYSYPKGDETDVFSRKMICDIINEFDLQWFFPYYLTQSQIATSVIGTGIKMPLDSERIVSSYLPVASGFVFFDLLGNQINEPFYYSAELCDRPYFSLDFINKGGLPTCEIDLVLMTIEPCDPALYPSQYAEGEFLMGEFEFYYLSMADRKNTEAHPFTGYGADLLPFCDSVDRTPESELTDRLHLKLYKSVSQLLINDNGSGTVSYADTFIMTKKMTALDVTEVTNDYRGDGKKYYYVTAYHGIGDFIADINGEICGIRNGDQVYLLETTSPLFNFLVISDEDGYLLYMGPERELFDDNSVLNGIDVRFKKTQSGIYYGTLIHAANINLPYHIILSMKEDGYETNAEAALAANEGIYLPLRSGTDMKYTYLNGKIIRYKGINGTRTKVKEMPNATETGVFVFYSDDKDEVTIVSPEPVFEE